MPATKRRRKDDEDAQPSTALTPIAAFASELRGVMTPVESLVPYARNARLHDAAQIQQIVDSIKEWGFTNPILADAEGIVAGHGRVLAAKAIYDAGEVIRLPSGKQIHSGTVPVIDCTGWTPQQRNAYVIADNKLALNAKWDHETLAAELEALGDFNAQLIGFSHEEFASILGIANAPEGFPAVDENTPTEHQCPKCGFRWSGALRNIPDDADDEDEGP